MASLTLHLICEDQIKTKFAIVFAIALLWVMAERGSIFTLVLFFCNLSAQVTSVVLIRVISHTPYFKWWLFISQFWELLQNFLELVYWNLFKICLLKWGLWGLIKRAHIYLLSVYARFYNFV